MVRAIALVLALISASAALAQSGHATSVLLPSAVGSVEWREAVVDFASLPTCDLAAIGSVRLDLDTGTAYWCDGSTWAALTGGGGGGTDDQTAVEVSITDAGGYYTGIEVETALQEIGADARWTDARTPTTHASTHAAAGSDPVTLTEAQISDLAHTTDTDTTCNDAGVTCLFAASVSEGGPATTASALAANGTNCAAGNYPLGVDAQGNAESCTAAGGGAATEIDADGDGNPEVKWDAARILIDLASDGTHDYDLRSAGFLGPASWILYRGVEPVINVGDAGPNARVYNRLTMGSQVNIALSRTCTDSGDANPGFLSAAVLGVSYMEVTVSDADGCVLVLQETNAVGGQAMTISLASLAGGTLDLVDSSGVQETGSGCSLGLDGTATLIYSSARSRWLMTGCEPSN